MADFMKSERCYRMRLLFAPRHNLKRKFFDIGNSIRHSLKALSRTEPCANRLRNVPGSGALNTTALAAPVGDASTFAKGRDFAAWLGLVPRQITTGGRPRLVGISKRYSTYMRVLLIHGPRSAMPDLEKMNTTLGAWLRAMLQRAKRNVVVEALANKQARITWAVQSTGIPSGPRRCRRHGLSLSLLGARKAPRLHEVSE